jgi:hypothetical protein
MRLTLIGLMVCLFACSSEIKRPSTFTDSDAGVFSKVDASVPTPTPTYVDAGPDTDLPPVYDPCRVTFNKPVTVGSADAQNCLVERYCADSLGNTALVDMYDTCHSIPCRWGLACNLGDPQVFCLPENVQSSVEYADEICSSPIVLVAFSNGKPQTKFVGLSVDLVQEAGVSHCVDIHPIGLPWFDDGNMYYLTRDHDGGTACNFQYIGFPGLKFYYLNPTSVDPSLYFVKQ